MQLKLFVRMEMKFYYDEISSYLVAMNISLVSWVQCPLLISSQNYQANQIGSTASTLLYIIKEILLSLFHTQRTIYSSEVNPFFSQNRAVHMNHP